MKKLGIVSLGCARNLVDSEALAAQFKDKGYKITDLDKAEVALVNTCAFIKEAKEESINTILNLVAAKEKGFLKKIIVAGCLVKRYKKDLIHELPEVDSFQGVLPLSDVKERLILTPVYYAYLKICEGCVNKCSFCAIPGIKGKFTSLNRRVIIEQVKDLDKKGCRELNVIGQDITAYGKDIYGKPNLPGLIKSILKECHKIKWLRLLYLSPERLSDELIKLIKSSPRIVKYIDLPLQHINSRILKLMRRKITSRQILRLIDKIRKEIPGVALRTSLIVGFPSETDKEFKELLTFIEKARFERLGLFMYSREEGTSAYKFPGQISEKVKQERYHAVMSCQQDVARKVNEKWQGKTLKVLIEKKPEKDLYLGRSEYDAPEVDGQVFVRTKKKIALGSFQNVKITDTLEYDLIGGLS